MTDNDKPARLHALDNLRAIMMWLGIVLHVAALHMARESTQLPFVDTHRTLLADLLVTVIHTFRMPVFFILAGFFAMMLVQTRGSEGMLANRAKRLGLPFAVFWLPIWLACGFAGLAYLHLMARGTWGIDEAVVPPSVPRGPNTMHMWFLWQLLWMCVATAALMRLPSRWFAPAGELLHRLAQAPWGFAVLALPVAAAGIGSRLGVVEVSGFFLPPWGEWLHSGMFFVFGLMMYGRREALFELCRARRWPCAVAGLLAYFAAGGIRHTVGPGFLFGYAYACAGWLWCISLIGFALVGLAHRRPVLAYLADSAYWVYLTHLPLVIFFGAVMYGAPIPSLGKILINIAATTAVTLLTYELLVRHTWVSVLLNGKRHPRRGAPPAAAAAA